jgi:hypothetical protein
MNRVGQWLWRWVRKLAKVDDEPLQTRLTKHDVLEIARRHLMGDGEELFRPGAAPKLENGRVVWSVITHVGYRGGHSRVFIDDETRSVIRTEHVAL